jgi:hypothetical protein
LQRAHIGQPVSAIAFADATSMALKPPVLYLSDVRDEGLRKGQVHA